MNNYYIIVVVLISFLFSFQKIDINNSTISQLKDLTHPNIADGFKLPRFDSIARRLVNDWIRRHE